MKRHAMQWRIAASLAVSGVVCALAAPSAAARAGDDRDVDVDVQWDVVDAPLTDGSFGLNAFQAFDPQVSGDPEYGRAMAYMDPGLVRFHSWESMFDSSEAKGWIDNANESWDEEKILASLEAFPLDTGRIVMNIPGFPGWMDADDDGYLDDGRVEDYAQFCAELVQIVNGEGGFGVEYWEPTNERDDNYYVHFANAGEADRLDELIDIYVAAAEAMKEADASISVGGAAFARPDLTEQVERFVEATVSRDTPTVLDFFSYHFYANGNLDEPDTAVFNRVLDPDESNHSTLAAHTKELRDILDRHSGDRHVPLWLDEFNISWVWTNNDPRMHNHKGAAFDALAMTAALRSGADATMAWNDFDGVYGKISADGDYRPAAHTYQLFNNYVRGDVVSTASSDESAVVAMASRDEDSRSLVLINRSATPREVDIDWNTDERPRSAPKNAVSRHVIDQFGYRILDTTWRDSTRNMVAPAFSVTVLTDSDRVPSIVPEDFERPDVDMPEPGTGVDDGAFLLGNVAGGREVSYGAEGEDWALWGTNPEAPLDAVGPANAASHISPVSILGDPSRVEAYTPDWWAVPGASWTGGSPIAEGNGVQSAIEVGGPQGAGFAFEVPASTDVRTLTIDLGVMGTKGVLSATLSDGSAEPYITSYEDSSPEVINNSGGPAAKTVALTYRAESDDATLRIEYSLNYNHWGDTLWLQGASLAFADTEAPTRVDRLKEFYRSSSELGISWQPSQDNREVVAYDVRVDGEPVVSVPGSVTSIVIPGLEPRERYDITVVARDAAHNQSAAASLTTTTRHR